MQNQNTVKGKGSGQYSEAAPSKGKSPGRPLSIVFLATSPFGIPALHTLQEEGHTIQAIITTPPTPSGRGKKLRLSPIHQFATTHCGSIPLLTAGSKTQLRQQLTTFLAQNNIQIDVAIVVSYGVIIPKDILQIARIAFLNIHPSLLPRWRGAAPIERAIQAGDTKTATCIIEMNEQLDAGPVIAIQNATITPQDNATTMHQALSQSGAKLLSGVLSQIQHSGIGQPYTASPQPEDGITYATKIQKEELTLPFPGKAQVSAQQLLNTVRAMTESGMCRLTFNGANIKIAEAQTTKCKITPLDTLCADDVYLSPTRIIPAGKKAMDIQSYVNGLRNAKGGQAGQSSS